MLAASCVIGGDPRTQLIASTTLSLVRTTQYVTRITNGTERDLPGRGRLFLRELA